MARLLLVFFISMMGALGAMAQVCPEPKPAAGVWTGTPLHEAIRKNDMRAFGRALAAGTLSERDSFDNTPLVAALTPSAILEPAGVVSVEKARAQIRSENAARQAMVSALLAKGAGVNEAGALGATPLLQLAAWGYSPAADKRLAQAFLQRGAQVDARDNFDSTALMLAARKGKAELVKLLLANGADAKIKNCHGETAASLASFGGYPAIAALLSP